MRGFQGPRLNKKAMQERNAQIVKLRDECGLTFKVIGQRFSMVPEGVQRAYRKTKEEKDVKLHRS